MMKVTKQSSRCKNINISILEVQLILYVLISTYTLYLHESYKKCALAITINPTVIDLHFVLFNKFRHYFIIV